MSSILEYLKDRYGYIPETDVPVSQAEEEEFAEILRGESSGEFIGRYKVLQHRDERRTVIFVHFPEISTKYIHALDDQGHQFFVAIPQEWCEYHFGIKGRIEFALSFELNPKTVAGGYVAVRDGEVECHGRSMDFGPGDHATAQWLFQKLFKEMA